MAAATPHIETPLSMSFRRLDVSAFIMRSASARFATSGAELGPSSRSSMGAHRRFADLTGADVILVQSPDDWISILRIPSERALVPNTGPTFENLVFDPTLYGLSATVVLISLGAAYLALRSRGLARGRALGTGLVAIGYAAIVLVDISLLVLFRVGTLGGVLYLQVEFAASTVGCLLVLYGLDRVVFANGSAGDAKKARAVMWTIFAISAGIAMAYLLDPLTYPVTAVAGTRHVAQEPVFYLPAFVTLVAGAAGLPVAIFRMSGGRSPERRHAAWVAAFFALGIAGVLKESDLIPSLGDPLLDMLVAFVPFTAASVCILMSTVGFRNPKGPA